MNIFFLNAGKRCELIESFAKVLPSVSPGIIWASDPDRLAPALRIVDRVVDLPSDTDSDAFRDQLCAFLKRESIDLVIPTIDPDLERLNRWRAEISRHSPGTILLVSSATAVTIAGDKRMSRETFAQLGAEVPEAVDPTELPHQFPMFIKPALGSASQGARLIKDRETLERCLRETPEPMLERVVSGDEITVDVLLTMRGEALVAIPRRRLKVRGGEVSRAVIERSTELEDLAMQLAEGIGCIGPVTLQFRNPAPGRWVAMEINARMGGGLPLTIAAGGDWPRQILMMACGSGDKTRFQVQDQFVMTRADRSFFLAPDYLRAPPFFDRKLPGVVIFDLDDTLYPESDFVRSAFRAVAQQVWNDFSIDIEPLLRHRFTNGQRGDLMTSVLLGLKVRLPSEYVTNILVPCYRQHAPSICPFVESIPVLSELKSRGHKLGLLTDGWAQVQRNKISALNIESYFDEIIVTDEIGKHAWKPSIIGFERMLERLSSEAAHAIYIADNPAKDFFGPKQLGMETVQIRRSGSEYADALAPERSFLPDWEVSTLQELLR